MAGAKSMARVVGALLVGTSGFGLFRTAFPQ